MTDLEHRKKKYFVSDAHLGFPNFGESMIREKKLVEWLEMARQDASEIFLLGDIFDFWYEYKRVVPRGFTRLLGKISEITDSGIPVHFFTGNHDIWVFDYLPVETGMLIHRAPYRFSTEHHSFFVSHGDGLGPGDRGYKVLKKIFTSRLLQWLFSRLHPNFALWIGLSLSRKSRYSKENEKFLGEDREYLALFSKQLLQKEKIDFFLYGHRHLPNDHSLGDSRMIYLGDWVEHFSYAVYDGEEVKLHHWSG